MKEMMSGESRQKNTEISKTEQSNYSSTMAQVKLAVKSETNLENVSTKKGPDVDNKLRVTTTVLSSSSSKRNGKNEVNQKLSM